MSEGWGNPIVGGTVLRIPAVQSGNFVTQVSGWQISVDGNAEFNNIQARGQVFVQGNNGSEIAILLSLSLPVIQLTPPSVIHLTIPPEIFPSSENAGAANEFQFLVLGSGKSNGHDDAAWQLFSEAADASVPAVAVLEFGGAVAANWTLRNLSLLASVQPGGQGTGAHIYSGTGVPTFSATGGDLYIRADGNAGSYLYACGGGSSWIAFA